MIRRFPWLLALSLVGSLAAQTDDAEPAENPAIKIKVDDLKKAARDRKFERDPQAIALISELGKAQAAGLHPKDRRRVLKTLATILTKGRLRTPPALSIYTHTAEALEHFGDDGAKALQRAYESKRFPQRDDAWVATRAQLLRSIGNTRSEGSIDLLIKVAIGAAAGPESAAAGEALGFFGRSDQEIRKQIAQALINRLAGLESESKRMVPISSDGPQDFGPQNARERLRYVYAPWTATLKRLTTREFPSAHEWQLWFNKARREDWDD